MLCPSYICKKLRIWIKKIFGCRQGVDPTPRLRTCPQPLVYFDGFPYISYMCSINIYVFDARKA